MVDPRIAVATDPIPTRKGHWAGVHMSSTLHGAIGIQKEWADSSNSGKPRERNQFVEPVRISDFDVVVDDDNNVT